ncbi:MAG: Eco57I restriction-modification methylase domain-containing protein, partial [Syntrophales bacterium]|nr:Eco57I restriction-modification methylase domain-containing protein [Syntrophales bacterium]
MHLLCLPPEKTINRSWLRRSIPREELDVFKNGLSRLFDRLRTDEGEEHLKNIVADFLKDVWYRDVAEINTKGDVDLVVHKGKSSRDPVAVIVETKRPGNVAEMVSPGRPNVKALHELILYYLRERSGGNIHLTRLIVSNIHTWYIFDAADFERYIYGSKELVGKFRDWEHRRLTSSRTDAFYKEIVHPFLEGLEVPLPCAVVDLRPYEALSRNPAGANDEKLTVLYQLFSPPHLLKLPFANDSNTLNREFYNELLHILGLEEIKEGGRKLIGRKPPARRDAGSLLENTINVLRVRGHGGHANHGGGKATLFPLLSGLPGERELPNPDAQNSSLSTLPRATPPPDEGEAEDRLFSTALELCITWINRLLFLKLLEGRLIAWHESAGGAQAFLRPPCLRDFDELEELFFEVLAVRPEERSPTVTGKFGAVPYLNSSLFEATDLERQTIRVADLKDRLELPLYGATVLKDEGGRRSAGALPTLAYLLRFLDAFDFSGEGAGGVRETPRTIINAAVLGLIFEKINGYREGSFFTPGFITMYICREAIRQAVVEKFRASGLPGMKKIKTCADLKERLNPTDPEARRQANAVIDSLTVCDPAVGSGHFLVSALNEIIALKGELGILSYPDGTRIKEYAVAVENDELVITDNDDERPFAYRLNKNGRPVPALQRLQEALFHEKQRLIEGCLFGVDINPKSVSICRLRLWIELLKHAYYTEASDYRQLETLPNIDINIKCGNSLISRFALAGGDQILPGDRGRLKALTDRYRKMVFHYKLSPANKGLLRREIDQLKEDLQGFSIPTDPDMKMLRKLDFDLSQTIFDFDRAGAERREQLQARAEERRQLIAEKQRTIYRAAFEWRYEFPEVLDKNGNFVGFNVVIGNPPYVRQELLGTMFKDYARSRYEVYHGVADLYAYFFELGLAILGKGGCFSIIVANKWMRAGYGAPLRKWLKNQGLELIVDFGDLPVFTEAATYPCIVTIRKAAPLKARVEKGENGSALASGKAFRGARGQASRESFRACTVPSLEALDLVELTRTGTV